MPYTRASGTENPAVRRGDDPHGSTSHLARRRPASACSTERSPTTTRRRSTPRWCTPSRPNAAQTTPRRPGPARVVPRPRPLRPAGRASGRGGDPVADDLAVVCGYYDFSARIRGAFRDVAGVSAVASPPEYRRRGLVRDLLTDVHRGSATTGSRSPRSGPSSSRSIAGWGTPASTTRRGSPSRQTPSRRRVRSRRGRSNGSTRTTGRDSTRCTTRGRATTCVWTAARTGGAAACSSRGTPTRTCTAGPRATPATRWAGTSSTPLPTTTTARRWP
ncbi:GNAT family N-acetyltransferase [Halobaculum litoreum]|uniref:GNAT family N-acetyltransferase n=1 Tax=Halobaculum litoreum TaxID=3031998 RepID=A0ABD5XSI1_9EURY